MSNTYLNWAFTQHVTGSTKAVLIALADRADDTGYCYPSFGDIAGRCGLSKRTVIRSVNKLLTLDKIEVYRQKGNRNGYFLKASFPQTDDTESPPKPYPQVTDCPELVTDCPRSGDTVSPKPSKNPQEPKKRRREDTGGRSSQVTTGHASFQTWTPAAATKSDPQKAVGELRSIKSILSGLQA